MFTKIAELTFAFAGACAVGATLFAFATINPAHAGQVSEIDYTISITDGINAEDDCPEKVADDDGVWHDIVAVERVDSGLVCLYK